MKRILRAAAFLLTLLLLSTLQLTVYAAPYPARTASPRDFDRLAPGGVLDGEQINAKYALLMDYDTGEVLFSKAGDEKAYPASTTKIMTCILALEMANLNDEITVGTIGNLPSDATNIALVKGEIYTMEEMLYGLMLKSGNDAAIAIAQHIAGSVEEFAILMNEKAAELGMLGTHYTNPHGLHEAEHYTTARDMAVLTRYAMQNEMFCKLAGTYSYKMRATNKHDARTWTNTNKLINPSDSEIYSYVYATGIKTGYTNAAAGCLVASAEKDGQRLIAVDLGDVQSTKWSTCITMFEYGFAFYSNINLADYLPQTLQTRVENAIAGDDGMLDLYVEPLNPAFVTVKRSALQDGSDPLAAYTQKVNIQEGLQAPVFLNQEVGTVEYYDADGTLVLTCALRSARAVEAQVTQTPADGTAPQQSIAPNASEVPLPIDGVGFPWKKVLVYCMLVILFLVLVVLIIRIVNLQRADARRSSHGGYSSYNRTHGSGQGSAAGTRSSRRSRR